MMKLCPLIVWVFYPIIIPTAIILFVVLLLSNVAYKACMK